MIAAAGSFERLAYAWASPAPVLAVTLEARERPQDAERSPNRDPWAIQRSTLVVNGLDPSELTEDYLALLKAGGVDCWHKSMGDVQSFADAYNFVDQHRDRITVVTSVHEMRQAHQQGKLGLLFGWQDAGVLRRDDRGHPVVPTALRGYHQLGLRIVCIVNNVVHVYGGGCLAPEVGITRAGRLLVEELHKLRILLDVGGHTGEQTSLDAIAMSSGIPVICSHSNVLALTDNPRCISDRLIEAIAKTGGVIGLTAFNDFHARTRNDAHIPRTPQVGLEKHLDQYDYIRKLVGADHVALGPDFVHGWGERTMNAMWQAPEVYSQMPWYYVKGFEDISELPNVTEGLIARGWSTGEICKVLGENWLRVYERVWGA